MIERNDELSRNLFLNEQDICNMAWKLAKDMYKKHGNDTQNVCMWAIENKDNVLFYLEINVEVDDGGSQRCKTCPSQLEYKHHGNER